MITGIAGALLILLASLILSAGIPQLPDSLEELVNAPPTIIYDCEGRIVQTLSGREPVSIENISPYFLNAIISAEDKNFYEHSGLDKVAIIRSFVSGFYSGKRMGGGSTITQQLAKNLFFTLKRDFVRKIREMLVAFQIESTFSKREILEAYCNQIPFGNRANGVERAARTYFGIPASDLDIAQSALLAGLPNSPSRLNPYSHLDNAIARQRVILSLMERNGFITAEERAEAEAESLKFRPLDYIGKGTWFIDRVVETCEARFGKDAVYYGGLKIFTTLRPDFQVAAENAVNAGIEKLNVKFKTDSLQGALIAMNPNTGAIVAHVGGQDYKKNQYDRAFYAKRRPGSSFKPFLYYPAIDKFGFSPASVILDSAYTTYIKGAGQWSPRNYDGVYYGKVIFKFALAQSLNTAAARLVEIVGADNVANTARQFGIKSDLYPVPSIVMGTSIVTPVEMASAYSVMATGGEYYEPYFLERVESPSGQTLYEHFIAGRRVANAESMYLLVDMLKEVLNTGTAKSARLYGLRFPCAGKTGTTDDYVDSWFIGFTPNLCVAVWVGYDKERPMITKGVGAISGPNGALPIWIEFMLKAAYREAPRDFLIPYGIGFSQVDIHTGLPSDDPTSMSVAVKESSIAPIIPDSMKVDTAAAKELVE